ncbi:hypothetical protein [Methylocystis echinoides]|uniref:hypothetical protein n=1 Tax=Methylocystis echinoides TaxID=29468 RepID=UPI00249290D7|nr:hypothetical protein [Methylocystis echinoides]
MKSEPFRFGNPTFARADIRARVGIIAACALCRCAHRLDNDPVVVSGRAAA